MKIDNHPEWTAMRSACCNDVDFCNDKNNLTLANIQSGQKQNKQKINSGVKYENFVSSWVFIFISKHWIIRCFTKHLNVILI